MCFRIQNYSDFRKVMWCLYSIPWNDPSSTSLKVKWIARLCLTIWDPMDCSLPGSSIHGILQARVLKWVALSFSRGSSYPRIEPGSSALQEDSLPAEPPGKPSTSLVFLNKAASHIRRGFASKWVLTPTTQFSQLFSFRIICRPLIGNNCSVFIIWQTSC